jgi:hypothetical protein
VVCVTKFFKRFNNNSFAAVGGRLFFCDLRPRKLYVSEGGDFSKKENKK